MTNISQILKCDDVKVIYVPQYEHLGLKEIIKFAFTYENVLCYLPITKELTKMSRKYICDVIYSIVGDDFENWVKARVDARHANMATKKDLMVSLDPEIAACFTNS